MNRKIICLFIFIILIIQIPIIFCEEINNHERTIKGNDKYQIYDNIDYSRYGNFSITENGIIKTDDGWYYYPPYPNYAPSGIPDFTNTQEDWHLPDIDDHRVNGIGCSTFTFANMLWYMDSMFSDPLGFPGDGKDDFNLVTDYRAPGNPNPGPYPDDHNFNNVNDPGTPWDPTRYIYGNELIETIRMYTGPGYFGDWEPGLISFISERNLSKYLSVKIISEPNIQDLYNCIENKSSTILNLRWVDKNYEILGGHTVALAGVNLNESIISISDPSRDADNPKYSNIQHNDASIVSHDMYYVNLSPIDDDIMNIVNFWSPYPGTYAVHIKRILSIVINKPPIKPIIMGQINGGNNVTYCYNITCVEPNIDLFAIFIDWGDNSTCFNETSDWFGPYRYVNNLSFSHAWSKEGEYTIRVKAKDEYGLESEWSDPLTVTMPKTKIFNQMPRILLWLFERFSFINYIIT